MTSSSGRISPFLASIFAFTTAITRSVIIRTNARSQVLTQDTDNILPFRDLVFDSLISVHKRRLLHPIDVLCLGVECLDNMPHVLHRWVWQISSKYATDSRWQQRIYVW